MNTKKVADFLRLIDENDKLSLTNLCLYVVLVKISLTADFNLVDAGALFITLLNYSGKKLINKIKEKKEENLPLQEVHEKLRELQDKVNAVSVSLGIKRTHV